MNQEFLNKITQGDCLELMQSIEDNSIDFILTDLPYSVTQNKKDIRIDFDKLWRQYNRIIKPNGCIALFGQGLFYVDLVNSNRKNFKYDIVWNKVLTSGFLNANKMPLRQHEQLAIFYSKTPTYNPQFTEGKPLHGKGTSYMNKEHKNQNYGEFKQTDDTRKNSTEKYPTSILNFKKVHPSKALHRTEKSIDLLKHLILTYTNTGDVVLDSCCGSSPLAVASIELKRNFICMELDEEYVKVSNERIKKIMQ